MLQSIIKDNRETVRNEDTDQNIFLIGDDCITFNPLEMGDLRVALIYDQDFTAVHLLDR